MRAWPARRSPPLAPRGPRQPPASIARPPSDLLSAIRAVASGDAVVAPAVTRRLLDAFLPHLNRYGVTSTGSGLGYVRRKSLTSGMGSSQDNRDSFTTVRSA